MILLNFGLPKYLMKNKNLKRFLIELKKSEALFYNGIKKIVIFNENI